MTRQLARSRPARRAPVDVDNDPDEYEDEVEDDKPSRSRQRRTSGTDVDERPSRRRRSRDEDEDEAEPDERPSRSRKPERESGKSLGGGWGAYRDQRAKKAAASAHTLQVKDKSKIIKFLDEEPFAVFEQHWLGQRAYTCNDNPCYMCDAGYKSRTVALFNVVDMDSAENLYWQVGPQAGKKIVARSEEKKTSPVNKDGLYFEITRIKQDNGFYDYTVDPIKERDLIEDYEIEPLTDAEVNEAYNNLFDESVIPFTSNKDLKAAVLADDDD